MGKVDHFKNQGLNSLEDKKKKSNVYYRKGAVATHFAGEPFVKGYEFLTF